MPLPVEAIQLDGGSEFKAEFERACQPNEQLLVLVELVTPRSIDPRLFPASLRSLRAPRRKGQGNDRNDTVTLELLHEQIENSASLGTTEVSRSTVRC